MQSPKKVSKPLARVSPSKPKILAKKKSPRVPKIKYKGKEYDQM